MKPHLIFWPVLAQVLLTITLYILLGRARGGARKDKSVDIKRAPYDPSVWPVKVRQVGNSLDSQFQAPVLFYALCFVCWATGNVGAFELSAATRSRWPAWCSPR